MTQTAPLPHPTDSWINGICQRFTEATGWPLRYETARSRSLPSFGSAPLRQTPTWEVELHGDNGLSGRLILDPSEDFCAGGNFEQVRDLSELVAELVSRAEVARWQLECRSQELATLVDIGRLLPTEEDLRSALSRLMEAAVQLTGFRSAGFFLLHPAGDRFQLKAEHHQEQRSIPFPRRDLASEAPDFRALSGGRVTVQADRSPLEALWLPRAISTAVALAVCSDDGPLGTLWVYDRRRREPNLREWHVLESICAQIAAVLERTVLLHESTTEHRLRHDVRIASESQTGNVYQNLPPEIGFEIKGFCTSRFELGGDLCELISLDEHRTVVLIGDACGDSVPAAMIMSAIRGAVHSLVTPAEPDVLKTDRMMERLNRTLHVVTPPHQFMSLIYAVIDTRERTLTYTNAGHPAPVLVHQGEVQELDSHGVLAGILEKATYGASTCPLASGDLLILFSDGVTEAMSDRCTLFRSRGIIDTVEEHKTGSAQDVLDAITERLKQHTGGATDDDRTLVVLRIR